MSERRFTHKPELNPSAVWGLAEDHPAMTEHRTLFPSTVVEVTAETPDRLLVSGRNNRKLGATVEKGRFKGYAIFSLSLEERATCPVECAVRGVCYGNGMQMARRHRIGDPEVFYDRLDLEILDLLDVHEGLLIRLHVLGDFPSVEYVSYWADVLAENDKVALYGYTSRATTAWGGDAIGDAIEAVKDQYPDRFRIRWSAPVPRPDGAMVIDHVPTTPKTDDGIVCPSQTDATACCASCALCWDSSSDTILFIKHGRASDAVVAQNAAEDVGGTRSVEGLTFPQSVVPKPINAPTPEVRMVAPTDLRIEAAYQRDMSGRSIGLIRKILIGWDWTKFKPPVCAETPEGLFVIDGQHTAIAAASHPGIVKIPVIVAHAKAIETRAAAFVAHNRDRLAMSPFQIIHAEAAAGDKIAQEVLALGQKTGAVIPRSAPAAGKAKPGTILSIADLRQAVAAGDSAVIERVLRIAVMIEAKPLPRLVFRALRMLLSAPHFAHVSKRPDSAIANAIDDVEILNELARERAAQTGEPNVRACASIIAEACAAIEAAA